MARLVVSCLILAVAAPTAAEQYQLIASYDPANFFDNFEFFTGPDPTSGFVQYVDNSTAFSTNLTAVTPEIVYLDVDHSNVYPTSGPGRPSVRVQSKMAFTEGLFVLDLAHMPVGCGTWPAYWTLGPEWPKGGEIDIIEGINDAVDNGAALHVDGDCSISPSTGQTASWKNTNCSAQDNGNVGCTTKFNEPYNYGEGFNRNGGGMYVMEWTNTTISIWFFPSALVPYSLRGPYSFNPSTSFPKPANFGPPSAVFEGPCSDSFPAKFFNHTIVFDTTFCGGWAGKSYDSSICPKKPGLSGNDACVDFVAENPTAFKEAWWGIRNLRVWQKVPGFETPLNVDQDVVVPLPTSGGHGAVQIPGAGDFDILDVAKPKTTVPTPEVSDQAIAGPGETPDVSAAGDPFLGFPFPDCSAFSSVSVSNSASPGTDLTVVSLSSPPVDASNPAANTNPLILVAGPNGLETYKGPDPTTDAALAAAVQAAEVANAIANLATEGAAPIDIVDTANPTVIDQLLALVTDAVAQTAEAAELASALSLSGADVSSPSIRRSEVVAASEPAVPIIPGQPQPTLISTLPQRQADGFVPAPVPASSSTKFTYASGEADNWVTEHLPPLFSDSDSASEDPPSLVVDPFLAYWNPELNPLLNEHDHSDNELSNSELPPLPLRQADASYPASSLAPPLPQKFTYASGEADEWVTEDGPLLLDGESAPGDAASSVVDAFTAYWNKVLNPVSENNDSAKGEELEGEAPISLDASATVEAPLATEAPVTVDAPVARMGTGNLAVDGKDGKSCRRGRRRRYVVVE